MAVLCAKGNVSPRSLPYSELRTALGNAKVFLGWLVPDLVLRSPRFNGRDACVPVLLPDAASGDCGAKGACSVC